VFVNHLCEAKGEQDGEANKAEERFAEFVIASSDSPVDRLFAVGGWGLGSYGHTFSENGCVILLKGTKFMNGDVFDHQMNVVIRFQQTFRLIYDDNSSRGTVRRVLGENRRHCPT
jgi:hypothetical protein